MKKLISLVTAVVLFALLEGCSSPRDASNDNFKKVINAYLDKNCIMVSPRNSEFPITTTKWLEKQKPKNTRQYSALVGIGILEVKDGSANVNKGMSSKEKITVLTKIYSLSEKGKKAFSNNTSRGIFESSKGFCVATYQVNEVSNFSEPSQAMGYTISNVNCSVSPKNIEDWATNEHIVKAFPGLTRKLEENQEKSTTLVLMNDGWVHEKEIDN